MVLTSASASAQSRTDVVVLANGDRITGEIMSLSRGRLELKTDDAGTIDIEWEHVARIESARQFEIAISDGRRLLGTLARANDRDVSVAGPAGAVTVPMPEVTRITPIGASFWARLEGSVDAGFSYTRSSGVAQVNLNADVMFRRPAFLIRLSGSGTLTYQSDDSERDDRGAAELSYVRYRGRTWFIAGVTRFDSNESLGILLRSQVGGVAGQRLVNTNRAQVELGVGLVGNDERGVDAEPTQNFEGLLWFSSSYYSYDRPKTNVDASVQYYPSLSNWGRQRIQIDTRLRRELLKDFYVSFDLFFTFDSRPPNPEAARSDLGMGISAGWSF